MQGCGGPRGRVRNETSPLLSWSGLSRPSSHQRSPKQAARWILGTSPRMTAERTSPACGEGRREAATPHCRGRACMHSDLSRVSRPSTHQRAPEQIARWVLGTSPRMTAGRTAPLSPSPRLRGVGRGRGKAAHPSIVMVGLVPTIQPSTSAEASCETGPLTSSHFLSSNFPTKEEVTSDFHATE